MKPEIQKWLADHGGPAGDPEPQGNGTTIHRATSGDYVVVVDATGTPSMFGFSPPTEGASMPAEAPAASPSGMGMSQRDLESQLAQFGTLGSGDFREETKQEDIPNPASTAHGGIDPDAAITIKGPVTYRTWVKPGTNQRLTVKVNPDQTYTQVFSGADPAIKSASSKSREAPGGNAWRDDGPEVGATGHRWGWNPDTGLYDRDLGPSPAAQGIGQQTKPAGPKGDIQTIAGRVKEYNPATGQYDIDHGPSTAPKEPEKPATVSTSTTEPFIVQRMPDGSLQTTKNPNYQGPKAEAGRSITIKGGDGKTYIVPIDAQGNAGEPKPLNVPADPNGQSKYTSTWVDKDTGEVMGITRGPNPVVEVVPRAGQTPGAKPITRAPSIPQIIVGQSQDALREAYDGIQAEVDAGRRTPAWGENRRKEVFETARLAVDEAHLHEQSRQFNQSTAYNVANARMGNQQGVLEFAVRSALSINGRIKKGSSAGAELFRNLFMLGMQMQQASGINDIKPGGGQSSVGNTPGQQGRAGAPGQPNRAGNPATRPPIDPGDTKAHAASADQAAANIAAGLESNGQPRERTPATATTGGGPPLPMPAAPTAASASAAVPSAPPTSVPAGPPPVAGQIRIRRTAVGPGGGTVGYETNVSQHDLDRQTPEERARWEIVAPAAPPGATTDPGFNRPDMQGSTPTDPGFNPPAMQGPDTTDPGFNRPLPQAMTPPPFAAMEQFRMPQIDPMAPPVDPMQGVGMPAALRHADVLSTPPWRLPADQLPDLVNQFGEDAVYSWPGMPREGAA